MEKIFSIRATHKNNERQVQKGFFIQADCYMCQEEKTFVGFTKKEALTAMTDAGWRDLDSDLMGISGCFYCGCDYKE